MPYPGFNFLSGVFTPEQQAELNQFAAYLQGYLSAEHEDDGSHGTITASGDITSEGAGTFDGNVTADADEDGHPDAGSVTDGGQVIIGAHAAPGGAMNRGSNGIDMRTNRSGSIVSRWRIGASDGGGDVRDLLFQDVVGALSAYTFRVYWDAGASEYAMEPVDVSPMRLGSNTLGERFTEVNGVIVRANSAYYERGRTAAVGEFTTPTFAAGDFTASTGSWTVDSADVATYAYSIVGKTLTVLFEINTTDVSATPTTLNIKIPGSFTAAKATRSIINVIDAGAALTAGIAVVSAGGTTINCSSTVAGGAWTATAADNTYVLGQITLEVQ